MPCFKCVLKRAVFSHTFIIEVSFINHVISLVLSFIMGKRLQWAIVYVEDPPSREVLCENEFTDVGEFAVQKVRKMKRKSWSKSHACTILRTGNVCEVKDGHFMN